MQPHHELILGGQKSGKTAHAERLAGAWLQQSDQHRAIYLATAQAWDDEMRQRIARHQQERALRVPGMRTVELARLPVDLPTWLGQESRADTAIVIDCLTLWLTHWLMPVEQSSPTANCPADGLLQAISACKAHIYLVSNEIGLGVIPLGAQTRAFVDALGSLNQRVAAVCSHVTLMVAGLPLPLKSV